jgi:DegV family protein with EDD domain
MAMTVKIITDSASDLTPDIAAKWGITVVPLYIKFGSETYRDGMDMTTDEFYRRLSHEKILPTTSAPSAGDFVEIYDKLAQETDEILAIMLSSKYSVTYDVALKGRELKKSQARVEVIDSYTAIMSLGLLCISAAEAAESGANLDECIDVVHSNMPRTHVRMAFDTLEYLKRGGRIGTAEALVGSMLKVNPILTIKDGSTEAVARTRSRSRAIEHLYNFASSFSNIEKLAIEDATTPDEAEIMADKLSSRFPRERIIRTKVSPVVGTHVGPHVLSVVVQGE